MTEDRLATIDVDVLQCPRCRDSGQENGNLHSTGVIIYDRAQDDETTRVTVVAHNGETGAEEIPSCVSGNPSAYRHGIAIEFDCEHGGKPILNMPKTNYLI